MRPLVCLLLHVARNDSLYDSCGAGLGIGQAGQLNPLTMPLQKLYPEDVGSPPGLSLYIKGSICVSDR